jgi:small-conductance mechanosensitive channel
MRRLRRLLLLAAALVTAAGARHTLRTKHGSQVAIAAGATSLPEPRQISIDEVTTGSTQDASSIPAVSATATGPVSFHTADKAAATKYESPILGLGTGILTGAGLSMGGGQSDLSEDGSVHLAKEDVIADGETKKKQPPQLAGGAATQDANKKRDEEKKKTKDGSKKGKDEKAEAAVESVGKWFTWDFWHLMVICAAVLLIYSEAIAPLLFRFLGHSFLLASTIFFIQMMTFMLVAIIIHDPDAAGAKHTLSLSTILTALSFLIWLFAVHLYFAGMPDQIKHLISDLSYVFRPLSTLIVVFLVVEGVLEESKSDWGNLVLLGSFIALGLAFGLSGLVKDIMCYFLIRTKNIFAEQDFIYYNGEIYQVTQIGWLFTSAYRMSTRSATFIPNSDLGMHGVNNQSRDDTRIYEAILPLAGSMKADAIEAIVKEGWEILRSQQEGTFMALNGQQIATQMDTDKSALYVDSISETCGNEFDACHVVLRLVAKYYYSHPPPWDGDTDEPDLKQRQMDWKMKWHYHVEWFLVEMKKIIDKHS